MPATSILQPGQLEQPTAALPELVLPDALLFAHRADRLRQLAKDHPLAEYLHFLAELAAWQQRELDRQSSWPGPQPHLLEQCRQHGWPPLAPKGWPRDASWQRSVREAVTATQQLLPALGRTTLASLLDNDGPWWERQADALLLQGDSTIDLATAPLIGAVLQVQWTHWAQHLESRQIGPPAHPCCCPVCGSPPVTAMIHATGSRRGLRYLHCSLCGSAWHVVRAKCAQCENTRDMSYYGLETTLAAVQIEVCPQCRSALKLLRQDRDIAVDPVADDIASQALDQQLSGEDCTAIGVNFFLL